MQMAESNFISILPHTVLNELDSLVAGRLLPEYGAIFAASGGAVPPDRLVFQNEADVDRFQRSVATGEVRFGDITIELQQPAAADLAQAVATANQKGLSITPRSADAGRRLFADTIDLWLSRVGPALDHWLKMDKLDPDRANEIRRLSPVEQVPVVFELEEQGIWFAKDLSKSIIYSVAPPGASQHLSMLAFDVKEFEDPLVRQILADHFWYQTVVSDLPHFTYLGLAEAELPKAGLKKIVHIDRPFWVPDL